MKLKLMGWLFLLALGGFSPKLFDGAVEWWNKPPEPPREEARRLITSLEAADGWRLESDSQLHTIPTLLRGNICISEKSTIWGTAKIQTGSVDISHSFTIAERRAIQRASETCLRKLTERTIDAATK